MTLGYVATMDIKGQVTPIAETRDVAADRGADRRLSKKAALVMGLSLTSLLVTSTSFLAASTIAQTSVPERLVASDTAAPVAVLEIDHAEPMELDRLADTLGDAALVELFESDDPNVLLRAILVSPHLRGPEATLPSLAALAAGTDPWLAPAAMASIVEIVSQLDPEALELREARPQYLSQARRALQGLADDDSARVDLRQAASAAIDGLDRFATPVE